MGFRNQIEYYFTDKVYKKAIISKGIYYNVPFLHFPGMKVHQKFAKILKTAWVVG